jgi:integrase
MADVSAKNRRDYGTGSLYQRASDGLWIGTIQAGWTERGTRRRFTVSGHTEAAARAKLNKKIQALADDGVGGNVNAKTTVKQWADAWLPIAERELSPNAYLATSSAVRKWIVPTIGGRRLSDLTPADVRKVGEAQRAAGLAASSRKRTHSVTMSMLKAARAEGHAVVLRVLETAPPKTPSRQSRDEIPVEDAVKMLQAASGDPAGARWVAALLQGMRQGECLGLTREQVDVDRGLIVLSWQLQPLAYNQLRDPSSGFRVPDGYEHTQVRGRWHLVRPKSEAGWRVIPMTKWMKSSLETWLDAMPDNDHGLLWHHPKGDPPKLDDAAWYALQERAGVAPKGGGRFTIHQARHTTATLLLEAGVDPAVITAILGHSSIVTSRGYMHARTDLLLSALDQVADRLALG